MTRQFLTHSACTGFVAISACAVPTPGKADDAFQAPPITVPGGYTIELAAAPPLVKHPMMAGFDDRGRLFVAEAAGRGKPTSPGSGKITAEFCADAGRHRP